MLELDEKKWKLVLRADFLQIMSIDEDDFGSTGPKSSSSRAECMFEEGTQFKPDSHTAATFPASLIQPFAALCLKEMVLVTIT